MAQQNQKRKHWKKLSSRLISHTIPQQSWFEGHNFLSTCSYYVDTHGNEWIVMLFPSPSVPGCNSYLYDVENDKFKPFIENYKKDINKKFNIAHASSDGRMTFLIDNDNHVLYWLQSSVTQRSLLRLDIRNLKKIKFIDQILLPSSIDGETFTYQNTMFLTENTIQFISYNSKQYVIRSRTYAFEKFDAQYQQLYTK